IGFVFLPIIAGISVSFQAAINGRLGKEIGTTESTYISFLTGSLFLFFVVLFFGHGQFMKVLHVPAWQLLCALFGIAFVFLMVYCVPKIGVTATTVMVIIGQLGAGMFIDHYGFFEQAVNTFQFKRLIGIVLLFIALYFIYREKSVEKT